MVDVKIPKLFTIEKEHIMEYLESFIKDVAFDYIVGKLHCKIPGIIEFKKICRSYFWDNLGKIGEAVFVYKDLYNYKMDGGKKRFKDSCYAKKDWIVFIENVDQVMETVMLLSHSLYMQNPVIDDDDVKSECIYSVILEKLMFRGVEKEDQKDKLIGENDQKY